MALPSRTIAALFVHRGGVYWDRKTIDAWDRKRDAWLYAGPHQALHHAPERTKRWRKQQQRVDVRGHKGEHSEQLTMRDILGGGER